MKKVIIIIISFIIVLAALTIIGAISMNKENITSDYRCAKCNGEYKIVEYVKGRKISSAIIRCQNCNNTFEITLEDAKFISEK